MPSTSRRRRTSRRSDSPIELLDFVGARVDISRRHLFGRLFGSRFGADALYTINIWQNVSKRRKTPRSLLITFDQFGGDHFGDQF